METRRLKRSGLLQVSVATTTQAEELVQLLMEKVFVTPASVYTNERTKTSRVSVFLSGVDSLAGDTRRALVQGLRRLKTAAGIRLGTGKISVKILPPENWAESWKRHFKPMEIGGALLVKPSWSTRKPRKGSALVVLDPGLSFGTGQHPTTGFCLQQLVRCRSLGQQQSFLDVGTGSGILAIAAAKLGYSPIEAFDFDPESVRVARTNAGKNRVFKAIRLTQADLTKLPVRPVQRFDFICANLISTLLLAEGKRIVSRLKPGGVLVLAGILRSEFSAVRRAYENLGLKYFSGKSEKEWWSGAFVAR